MDTTLKGHLRGFALFALIVMALAWAGVTAL